MLELELTDDNVVLEDVHIRFPVTAQARPQIAQAEPGEASYDQGGQQNQDYKYKVHPNLNKASYANNVLEVRDAKNAFRQNQPAPLLKWMRKSGDDAFLPVTLSCCPMAIQACYHQSSNDAISYACEKSSSYQLLIDN